MYCALQHSIPLLLNSGQTLKTVASALWMFSHCSLYNPKSNYWLPWKIFGLFSMNPEIHLPIGFLTLTEDVLKATS